MKYELVLQFSGQSLQDYDALIALEERLGDVLGSAHFVDGHDMGCDEMNIFVATDDPTAAFTIAQLVIPEETLGRSLEAAYRNPSSDTYVNLWPPGSTSPFEVK